MHFCRFLVFYFISEFFISLNFETIDLKSQHFLYHCRSSSRRNGASPNSIVHDTKNSVTTAACNKMAATSNTAQNTAHWQHGTKYKHKDMPNKNFVYLCVWTEYISQSATNVFDYFFLWESTNKNCYFYWLDQRKKMLVFINCHWIFFFKWKYQFQICYDWKKLNNFFEFSLINSSIVYIPIDTRFVHLS